MPFTPFHMGPGLLIKAILQGSFSLMVFGWAQILMDIQPLIAILTGAGCLHGFSHTYVGAALIAAVAGISGKYLSEIGLRVLNVARQDNPIRIAWWISLTSAFIGTFSHVLLDSIMHADVVPYFPLHTGNDLLGLISTDDLHKFCLYSGLIGAGTYYIVRFFIRKPSV